MVFLRLPRRNLFLVRCAYDRLTMSFDSTSVNDFTSFVALKTTFARDNGHAPNASRLALCSVPRVKETNRVKLLYRGMRKKVDDVAPGLP